MSKFMRKELKSKGFMTQNCQTLKNDLAFGSEKQKKIKLRNKILKLPYIPKSCFKVTTKLTTKGLRDEGLKSSLIDKK